MLRLKLRPTHVKLRARGIMLANNFMYGEPCRDDKRHDVGDVDSQEGEVLFFVSLFVYTKM